MIRKFAVLGISLLGLSTPAFSCSPGESYYAPGNQGPAPMCVYNSGSTLAGPIIDLGNNRIAQPNVILLMTAACGSGYSITVYDCKSRDVINLSMSDDDQPRTYAKFDYTRWVDPEYVDVLKSSAMIHRLMRGAARDRAGFIRTSERTRPLSRAYQMSVDQETPSSLKCGCDHYYPDIQPEAN